MEVPKLLYIITIFKIICYAKLLTYILKEVDNISELIIEIK